MGIIKIINQYRFGRCWKSIKKFTLRKIEGKELVYAILKGVKVHSFYTFMQRTFCRNIFTLFQWIWNQHPIVCFFDNQIKILWKQYFWGHIPTFYHFWRLTRTKRLKNYKSFFQTWIITINFLKVWWHAATLLFIFTLIEQTYKVYIYYSSRTLLLSSWLSLGRGPPLGCRAKIRTQACLNPILTDQGWI